MNNGELSSEEIGDLPGNLLAADNPPDLYMICDVDPETAMKRKSERDKKDCCKFETVDFQKLIHQKYQSAEIREILESEGSMVVYINTDDPRPIHLTRSIGPEILKRFAAGELKSGDRFLDEL